MKNKNRIFAALTALAMLLTLIIPTPAGAITGNFTKDFTHNYVGLVAFYDASGEFLQRCSGALLSPTIFLTAGHCPNGATSARIWFSPGCRQSVQPGDRRARSAHRISRLVHFRRPALRRIHAAI